MQSNNHRFRLYIKSNAFYWSNNKVLYSIMIACLIIYFFKAEILKIENKNFDNVVMGILIATLWIGIGLKFIGFTKTEPLNGKFEGFLFIDKNSININNRGFQFEEVKNIEISNDDYYGKLVGISKGNFNCALSNGVNNYIKIKLYSGEIIINYFELYYANDFQKLRNELINFYLNGKIEFENLASVLGEKSKKEINELKLEIEKMSVNDNI